MSWMLEKISVFIYLTLSTSPEPAAVETSLIWIPSFKHQYCISSTLDLIQWVCLHFNSLNVTPYTFPFLLWLPVIIPLRSVTDASPLHMSLPLSSFKHLWLWCHNCETTALFPLVPLCHIVLLKEEKILLHIKNNPCKNVQDSYFIYPFLFLFVNKMVRISLSLVVILLISVYWPIKTCFRLYSDLLLVCALGIWPVCVCVRACVFSHNKWNMHPYYLFKLCCIELQAMLNTSIWHQFITFIKAA